MSATLTLYMRAILTRFVPCVFARSGFEEMPFLKLKNIHVCYFNIMVIFFLLYPFPKSERLFTFCNRTVFHLTLHFVLQYSWLVLRARTLDFQLSISSTRIVPYYFFFLLRSKSSSLFHRMKHLLLRVVMTAPYQISKMTGCSIFEIKHIDSKTFNVWIQ